MRNTSLLAGYYPAGSGSTRRLYAELHGERRPGQPVIILEVGSSQAGTKDAGWWPLRDAWAADAAIFLYDRAGLGASDPAPLPRTIDDFTRDLHAVLQSARVDPPYLLVGGSHGGLIVTHFAAQHPADIAGIVLVDSTHPEHNLRTLALLPPPAPGEPPALTHFRDLLLSETYTPLATSEQEGFDFLASIPLMRAAWDLGDIPLSVLTAGEDEWEEGFPMDVAAPYEQLWLDLQYELAARSTRGTQTTIPGSGHIMHADAPSAIDYAVRHILANCQPPV